MAGPRRNAEPDQARLVGVPIDRVGYRGAGAAAQSILNRRGVRRLAGRAGGPRVYPALAARRQSARRRGRQRASGMAHHVLPSCGGRSAGPGARRRGADRPHASVSHDAGRPWPRARGAGAVRPPDRHADRAHGRGRSVLRAPRSPIRSKARRAASAPGRWRAPPRRSRRRLRPSSRARLRRSRRRPRETRAAITELLGRPDPPACRRPDGTR